MLLRRLEAVYPTYVFAVCTAAVAQLYAWDSEEHPTHLRKDQLVIELALLQSWYPDEAYITDAYNVPAKVAGSADD